MIKHLIRLGHAQAKLARPAVKRAALGDLQKQSASAMALKIRIDGELAEAVDIGPGEPGWTLRPFDLVEENGADEPLAQNRGGGLAILELVHLFCAAGLDINSPRTGRQRYALRKQGGDITFAAGAALGGDVNRLSSREGTKPHGDLPGIGTVQELRQRLERVRRKESPDDDPAGFGRGHDERTLLARGRSGGRHMEVSLGAGGPKTGLAMGDDATVTRGYGSGRTRSMDDALR